MSKIKHEKNDESKKYGLPQAGVEHGGVPVGLGADACLREPPGPLLRLRIKPPPAGDAQCHPCGDRWNRG